MKTSKKYLGLLIAISLLTIRIVCADENTELSQLMSYFGSTCPSQGQWTQAALGQTEALVSVIQSVQNDPDCQTISGAMGQLQILNQQIQTLSSETAQTNVLTLQQQQQQLLLQYATEADPSMQAIIQTSLASTQVNLTEAQSTLNAQNQVQAPGKAQTLATLVSSTGIFMNQALANQACLIKHPSILPGIASLAGTVAASAVTPASSAVGLGLAAGTQILDGMVEFIREKKLAKQVHSLAQGVAETAYQCVLESLSNQWCSAQDALNLVDIQAQALTSPKKDDPVWQGAELLDHELPLFLNWLAEVEAGTAPTNDAEAASQKRVFDRDADVKTDQAYGTGIIQETLPLMVAASDLPGKWNVEKTAIIQFVTELATEQAVAAATGGTNPLLDINGSDYAPYFLLGLTQAQAPKVATGFCPMSVFNPFVTASPTNPCGWPQGSAPFNPDLTTVQTNIKAWVALAQKNVDSQLSSVLQSDPLQIIADAITPNIQGRSVTKSIDSFVLFLTQQENAAVATDPRLKSIYMDSISKLQSIQADISNGSKGKDEAAGAIEDIYSLANLTYGTALFQNRLQEAIRLNLNAVVTSGNGVSNSSDILLLTAGDLLSELQSYNGSTNLTTIESDATQGQRVTESALTDFTATFGKNINDTLKTYAEDSSDPKANDLRAALCLKLLAVPSWPEQVSKNYCIGAQIQSIFKGGPSSVKITSAVMQAPLQTRACYYTQYLRNAQIYQNYVQGNAVKSER